MRRSKSTPAKEFLFKHMDTMIAIYKLFMAREVPPREGRILMLAMAEIESDDPDSDDSFLAAVQKVLDREGRMEQ